MTFKNGSGPLVLSTSEQTIATCPSATEWGVKLTFANLNSVARTFVLKHFKYATATTTIIAQDKSVAANNTDPFVWTLTMEPGDTLSGIASANGSIVVFPAITNADTSGGNSAIVPKGAWSSVTTYAVNEAVSFTDGYSYLSLQAGNLNHSPDTSSAYWMVLAARGNTPALTIGTTTGLSAGASPTASFTGLALNLGIPAGATGPAPSLTIGTVSTLSAGASATASLAGSSSPYTLNLGIPQGTAGTGSGDVVGPSSSVNNEIALFSGTTGKLLKSAGVTLALVASSGSASDLGAGTLPAARLPASGATAATYGHTGANVPDVTVDATGRITGVVDRALTAANVGALAKAGDTATGKINMLAAASGTAGFNLGAGAAPTSPVSADLWGTTAGLFYFNGTATIQFAPLASPTFTGTPAVPTASVGTNTTQAASTAFVLANLPVKAAGSDVYGGTEDTKFVTAKALADSGAVLALTDGATVSWNMANGYNAKVTLGGNRTLATPTNPKEGQTYTLRIIQDGTGSRTLTLPSSPTFGFGAAGAPTLQTAASKYDLLTLFCFDASTPKFLAFFNKGA